MLKPPKVPISGEALKTEGRQGRQQFCIKFLRKTGWKPKYSQI
jgi:hypothetical protein